MARARCSPARWRTAALIRSASNGGFGKTPRELQKVSHHRKLAENSRTVAAL